MGLTIHREQPKPRLVTMGQADRMVYEPLSTEQAETLDTHFAAGQAIPNQPLEPDQSNKGRTRKMAKDKDLSEAGTKTIRKDDADEQGAVGTHGRNAPAQEKVPESKGDKEERANG